MIIDIKKDNTSSRISNIMILVKKLRLKIGFIFGLPFTLFGILFTIALMDWDITNQTIKIERIIASLTIAIAYLPTIFVYNDFIDYPQDAKHPTKSLRNFFCTHTKKENFLALLLTVIIPTLICILCSFYLGIELLLISLFVFVMGFIYSYPIRLKEIPFLDFISHGIYVSSYFFLLGATAIESDIYNLLTNPIFLIVLLVTWADGAWLHYRAQINDIEIDTKTDQRTTSTWLGKKGSIQILRLLLVILLSCLPLYILFNNSLWESYEHSVLILLLIVSILIVLYYIWETRGGENLFYEIEKKSESYRFYFIYPFGLACILLLNTESLLKLIF